MGETISKVIRDCILMRTNVAAVSVGVLYSVCMTVSHHWERSFFKVFFHKSRVVGEYPVNEELKKKEI